MSVGNPGGEADVGTVYVLLIDPASDDAVAQVAASVRDGRYRFRFDDIDAGEYQLVAGSDADNDRFICDPGEACGAWLTLDQPGTVQLDGDIQELSFPLEYQVFIPEAAAASLWQGGARPRTENLPRPVGGRPRPGPQRGR